MVEDKFSENEDYDLSDLSDEYSLQYQQKNGKQVRFQSQNQANSYYQQFMMDHKEPQKLLQLI